MSELEDIIKQRDARTQEAAQAQARVKVQKEVLRRCERWLERAVRFAGDPLASEATPVLAAVRQSLSESPPTAALDAAIAKAREEERERILNLAHQHRMMGNGLEVVALRDLKRAAGLREGEKP